MKIVRAVRRSVPAKLLIIFLMTTVILLTLLTVAWGIGMRHHFTNKIAPHIVQYVDYVTRDLGSPPSEERAREISREVPVNIHIISDGRRFSSLNEPLDLSDVDFEDADDWRSNITSANGQIFAVGDLDDRTVIRTRVAEHTVYYEVRHNNFRGPSHHRKRAGNRKHRDKKHFPLIVCALLLATLAGCYGLIRRLLRPVRDIQAGVRKMGKGELDQRILIRSDDDLGELAGSINTMASDIEQMLDAKRQLLLGISHELRSPITRAKISTELLEPGATRDRIAEDLNEMESLVTELLETERLNSPHSVLNLSAVDAGDLIQSVATDTFAGQVTVDVQTGVTLNLDETRLRLLLRNLIGNAVRHGADANIKPAVTSRLEGDRLIVEVTDHGPGIDPEHLEHLTDPFYRVDPSRTRATGGFGLGLYLSRLICEAHNGSLEITSEKGKGTTVRAELRNVDG